MARPYQTPRNDHGQLAAWRRSAASTRCCGKSSEVKRGDAASVRMRYVSKDGDQGYPGTLTVFATYYVERSQRAAHRIHGDDRSADHRQHHQSRSTGIWRARDAAVGAMGHCADDSGGALHAGERQTDPDGRAATGRGHSVRFPHSAAAIGARVRRARDQQIVFTAKVTTTTS